MMREHELTFALIANAHVSTKTQHERACRRINDGVTPQLLNKIVRLCAKDTHIAVDDITRHALLTVAINV